MLLSGIHASAARNRILIFVNSVFQFCVRKFNFNGDDFIIEDGGNATVDISLAEIVTHELNSNGNPYLINDDVFGDLIDIAPLVVVDNNGNVVRSEL